MISGRQLGTLRSRVAFGVVAAVTFAFLVVVPRLSAQATGPVVNINPQDSNHNVNVNEGLTGTQPVNVTFQLSADNAHEVDVPYKTQDGDVYDSTQPKATAGSDYVAQTGTVVFPPHTTSKQVTFNVKGDQIHEPNEMFSVVYNGAVTTSDGFTAGDQGGTVTILDDDQAPSVFLDDASAPEGNAGQSDMNFTLRLSAPLGEPGAVKVTTQPARAVPNPPPSTGSTTPPEAVGGASCADGIDFIARNGDTVVIPAGVSSMQVPVHICGDTIYEFNDEFELQLSAAPNGNVQTPTDYGTGTIKNDDALPVLDVNDTSAPEGNGGTHCNETTPPPSGDITACNLETFTVTLTPKSEVPVHVDYATADRSAVSGSGMNPPDDYVSTSGSFSSQPIPPDGSLHFAPGETSHQIQVPVLGDTTAEPDERFALDLSNPSNAQLGRGEGFGVITNDDGGSFPTVSVNNAPDATEGSSGSPGTSTFTFTAHWPGGNGVIPPSNTSDVTVFYTTADGPLEGTTNCGTAVAGSDYVKTTGSVTLKWSPGSGDTTSMTVSVPLKGDSIHENDECFQMQISDASNAQVNNALGQALIHDDDPVPNVSIAPTFTIAEGTSTTPTVAHIPVTLSGAAGSPVTVTCSTPQPNSGTASVDADYTNTSQDITFQPGETAKTCDLQIVADSTDEPDETVNVILSNPSGANIANGSDTTTITDDDNPPSVSIANTEVTEGDTGTSTATFAVSLSAPSGKTVTVNAATSDGTAKNGSDYTAKTQTLTFNPGTSEVDFQVSVNGDTTYETDETFTATLSSPTNATLGSPSSATGTILNDDAAPTVSIDNPAPVFENAGKVTFTLTLSSSSGADATVHVKTADGTAKAGTDYTAVDKDVLMPAGTTTLGVDVPINNDNVANGDRSFTMSITSATNATISSANHTGTATIKDDENLPTVGVSDASTTEGGKDTFTFTASAAPSSDVVITYSTADGTAKAGSDYTGATNATATIAAGHTTTTADIQTTDDNVHESTETFTLTINNVTNAAIDQAHKTGTGTIVDNDTVPQITTGAGPGGGPRISTFAVGSTSASPDFMDGSESTGKTVARGDVDGDGSDEIITGSGKGSAAVLSVYSSSGRLLASTFAYVGGRFYGGVNVAAGDVDHDGIDEIITGAGPGGGPDVEIWKYANGQLTDVRGYYAYGQEFTGGVTVAAADVNGDGHADIITGPGAGGGPDVEVHSGADLSRLFGFMAYTDPNAQPNWTGGINVAGGDLDHDGKAEIAVVPWPGGGPHLRLFNHDGTLRNQGIFVGPSNFPGGLTVAMGDLNGDGNDEIVVGAMSGTNAVRAFNADLTPFPNENFQPYGSFGGGDWVSVGKA